MRADEYEGLRESFRPERVGVPTTVLLLGESRPDNGTFFYKADSNLHRYTVEAFTRAFRTTPAGSAFLPHFQSQGFFLVDICERPANKLSAENRQAMRRSGERKLAAELKRLPKGAKIIVVMKDIKSNAERAIVASGRADLAVDLELPFPQRWPRHIEAYVKSFAEFLRNRILEAAVTRTRRSRRTVRPAAGVTLHEEIQAALRRNGNRSMTSGDLANAVNRRGIYKRGDGQPVPASQISARVRQYEHLFHVDPSGIRLRESGR